MNTDPKTLLERFGPKEVGKPLPTSQQLCMVRFSPCGKVLAAGGFDNQVHRWDATANPLKELPPLTGHHGWVQAIVFHPDAQRLFSADTWGQIRCWPYAEPDAKPLWSIAAAHDGWIRKLALSPDGQTLASCGRDGVIRLWSTADGKKQKEFVDPGTDLYALVFHPDGKSLVSGDLKGAIKQWDLASGKAMRTLDAEILYLYDRIQDVGGVRCLAFDLAGGMLVCGGGQPTGGGFVQGTPVLLFFDWQTGKVKHTVKLGTDKDGFVYDVHMHPEGFAMAVTSGQPGQGKLLFQVPDAVQPFFMAARANCHSLAVHPDGKRLVICATNANSSGNGRKIGKSNEYPGNFSPLLTWEMPAAKK